MAFLDLYWDTISKRLVKGIANAEDFNLPTLRQEEGVNLSLTVLKRVSYFRLPIFETVNTSGVSLQVSIGTANSVLASQNTWDELPSAGKYSGTLGLNTAGIDALADGASVYFEIRLFDGTYYYGKRHSVKIEKGIALAASLQAPPGDTALGKLEADRVYVKKEGLAGEGKIWTSPDGTKKMIQYLDNDGTLRLEPIT